jgi:hypothetical protein
MHCPYKIQEPISFRDLPEVCLLRGERRIFMCRLDERQYCRVSNAILSAALVRSEQLTRAIRTDIENRKRNRSNGIALV